MHNNGLENVQLVVQLWGKIIDNDTLKVYNRLERLKKDRYLKEIRGIDEKRPVIIRKDVLIWDSLIS
jgi:hypothetical protein